MKLFSLAKNGSCSHPDACVSFARFSANEFVERTGSHVFHHRRRLRTKTPRHSAVEYSLDAVNEYVSVVELGFDVGSEGFVVEEFRHSTLRRCSVALVAD